MGGPPVVVLLELAHMIQVKYRKRNKEVENNLGALHHSYNTAADRIWLPNSVQLALWLIFTKNYELKPRNVKQAC